MMKTASYIYILSILSFVTYVAINDQGTIEEPKPNVSVSIAAAPAKAPQIAIRTPKNTFDDIQPNTNWRARDISGGALDELLPGVYAEPFTPVGKHYRVIRVNHDENWVEWRFNDLYAQLRRGTREEFLSKFER